MNFKWRQVCKKPLFHAGSRAYSASDLHQSLAPKPLRCAASDSTGRELLSGFSPKEVLVWPASGFFGGFELLPSRNVIPLTINLWVKL